MKETYLSQFLHLATTLSDDTPSLTLMYQQSNVNIVDRIFLIGSIILLLLLLLLFLRSLSIASSFCCRRCSAFRLPILATIARLHT
jgi:hypothetical protein